MIRSILVLFKPHIIAYFILGTALFAPLPLLANQCPNLFLFPESTNHSPEKEELLSRLNGRDYGNLSALLSLELKRMRTVSIGQGKLPSSDATKDPFSCSLCIGGQSTAIQFLRTRFPSYLWRRVETTRNAAKVFANEELSYLHHSYIYEKSTGIIVDPTYKQFLVDHPNVATKLPPIFIGDKNSYFHLMKKYIGETKARALLHAYYLDFKTLEESYKEYNERNGEIGGWKIKEIDPTNLFFLHSREKQKGLIYTNLLEATVREDRSWSLLNGVPVQ